MLNARTPSKGMGGREWAGGMVCDDGMFGLVFLRFGLCGA